MLTGIEKQSQKPLEWNLLTHDKSLSWDTWKKKSREALLVWAEIEPYLDEIELWLNQLLAGVWNIDIGDLKTSTLTQLRNYLVTYKNTIIDSLNNLKLHDQEKLDYSISDKEFINEIIIYLYSKIGKNISAILAKIELYEIIERTRVIVLKLFNNRVSPRVSRRYNRFDIIRASDHTHNNSENINKLAYKKKEEQNITTEEIKQDELNAEDRTWWTTIKKTHNELAILLKEITSWKLNLSIFKSLLNLIEKGKEKLNIKSFLELFKIQIKINFHIFLEMPLQIN